jgi:hypothetical protein
MPIIIPMAIVRREHSQRVDLDLRPETRCPRGKVAQKTSIAACRLNDKEAKLTHSSRPRQADNPEGKTQAPRAKAEVCSR